MRYFGKALLITLLLGCSSDDDLIKLIDAQTFTVNTPKNWTLIEEQWIDSYVGQIVGSLDAIHFDEGYFSFGSLDNITENSNSILFQKLEIDGITSIIHKESIQYNSDNEVVLSVYIDAGDNKRLNWLYVFDPENEELILQIFKTHKFK